jgi:hypothetical protein
MGFFNNLDASIKWSMGKPAGSKMTKEDLTIRMRHCYLQALRLQKVANDNPEAAEIKAIEKMRDDFVKAGDGFFYKLVK